MRCITLTVDAIIPYGGGIVLIKRMNEPFKDHYALPGGIVEYGESVEEALVREVKEETGLDVEPYKLVGVYSDPNRDPRGHFVSVCFVAIPRGGELRAGSDAGDVGIFKLSSLPKLAFDHDRMVEDSKEILAKLGLDF
ncbi:MAG: NUDIX hydrolase [Archaeoglobales archaeon]|nr:MAG: NUDIX hydrolase [Archaeoglobales archaeon]